MKLLLIFLGLTMTTLVNSQEMNPDSSELSFLMRALPDNAWYLNLHKDGTYDYKHISLFYDGSGTILEKGEYRIEENRLLLKCMEGDCHFKNRKLFLEKLKNGSGKPGVIRDKRNKYRIRIAD